MCLLMAAHAQHADYRLIVAANRDEYYVRPAAPAAYWNDNAWILGGRDEQGRAGRGGQGRRDLF